MYTLNDSTSFCATLEQLVVKKNNLGTFKQILFAKFLSLLIDYFVPWINKGSFMGL